ncbi:MAG: TonB-dependent receptor plug domain-containing protein, partial [Sphingobacterium sp.]
MKNFRQMTSGFYRRSTKRSSAFLLMVGLGFTPAFADSNLGIRNNEFEVFMQQQLTVSGSVLDDQTRTPLAGVTVVVGGSPRGTTDQQGRFEIQVQAGQEVVFQSVGYQRQAREWKESTSNVVISLLPADEEITEVVVTALGIKREEKSLGYAVGKISGDQMTEAVPSNWVDAMKGKVAGLNIIQPSSGPLNTARINLRGDRSLNLENNEALIVVDGIPLVNGRFSSGVTDAYGAGSSGLDKDIPVDFGNGLGDINPDDIESISVLKGAAATALYGSRAGNGALIITTKTGKRNGPGIGVTVNSNTSFQTILKWPDFQYEYGQGNLDRNAAGEPYYSYGLTEDGTNTGSTSSAWGPKFDGQMFYQYDPELEAVGTERTPWVPYRGGVKDFFRTAATYMNSVAFDGGNEDFSA